MEAERNLEDIIKARIEESKSFTFDSDNKNTLFVPAFFMNKDEDGEFEIPKEHWTIFEFLPLNQKAILYLQPCISDLFSGKSTGEDNVNSFEKICNLLDKKLVRIKNLYDDKIKKIEYKKSMNLENYLTFELVVSITSFLLKKNSLSEEEREGLTF